MQINLIPQDEKENGLRYWVEVCSILAKEIPFLNIYLDHKVMDDISCSSIDVYLISNEKMIELNNRFRGKNKTTDVLTFNSFEVDIEQKGDSFKLLDIITETPFSSNELLAEIFICQDVAQTQAQEFGHSIEDEITRLLIHGSIHALGFDHEQSSKEAKFMLKQEKILLEKFNTTKKIVPVTVI